MRGVVRVGELTLDPATRAVRLAGQRVELAAKEFALLQALAEQPTRVYGKQELLRDVWGYLSAGNTRTLDAHACRLRKKLRPSGRPWVVNVRGVGYKLTEAPVSWWGVVLAWGGWARGCCGSPGAAAAPRAWSRTPSTSCAVRRPRSGSPRSGSSRRASSGCCWRLELDRMGAALGTLARGARERRPAPAASWTPAGWPRCSATSSTTRPSTASARSRCAAGGTGGRCGSRFATASGRARRGERWRRAAAGSASRKRAARELGGRLRVESGGGVTRAVLELPARASLRVPCPTTMRAARHDARPAARAAAALLRARLRRAGRLAGARARAPCRRPRSARSSRSWSRSASLPRTSACGRATSRSGGCRRASRRPTRSARPSRLAGRAHGGRRCAAGAYVTAGPIQGSSRARRAAAAAPGRARRRARRWPAAPRSRAPQPGAAWTCWSRPSARTERAGRSWRSRTWS